MTDMNTLRLAAAAFAMTVLGACGTKVTAPSSDTTPPIIKWRVINKTANNATQDFVGNTTINAKMVAVQKDGIR